MRRPSINPPKKFPLAHGDKINLKFIEESVIAKQIGDIGISCTRAPLNFPIEISDRHIGIKFDLFLSRNRVIINMFMYG